MTIKLFIAATVATLCLLPANGMAASARFVSNNAVISRGDPAVEIQLPKSFRYVGSDRFFLSQPKLGKTENSELFAFVDSPDGRQIRRYIWVQFEGYLPGHPDLHMTYDSPRHATIGGLDFYEDEGVGSGAKTPKPGSDTEHFYSLLTSHGYQRSDLRWVRLVHLLDASKRKELMIIYAESLSGSGYTAAQLDEGGAEHAKWLAMDDGLRHRAEQSIHIAAH